MGFKKLSLKVIVPVLLIGFLFIGLLSWKIFFKTDVPAIDNNPVQNQVQDPVPAPQITRQPEPGISNEEDAAIQQQLDRDRLQQKKTKELKIQLEQTNLELEQEKALAEIDKLKKEDVGAFNDPAIGGQNNMPEIKVDFIGGDPLVKEAILSIGGTSYQVKEKSNPTDNIQVMAISDSGVTLHFSAPQDLTKTIDYKPE